MSYMPKGCRSCRYKAVMHHDEIDGSTCVVDDFSSIEYEDAILDKRPEYCPFNLETDPLKDKYYLAKKSGNKKVILCVGSYNECEDERLNYLELDDEAELIIEKLENYK